MNKIIQRLVLWLIIIFVPIYMIVNNFDGGTILVVSVIMALIIAKIVEIYGLELYGFT